MSNERRESKRDKVMDEPSTYVALQVALSKVARLTVENERLKLLLKYANEVIEEKQPVVHSND